MKKSIIALIVIAIGGLSFTFANKTVNENTSEISSEATMQASGIKFTHTSLAEAKAMAKKSGKLVFIDCYTTWCGPCKVLSTKVFTDPAVGAYFNKNFINVKLDMEKSADGRAVGSQYAVQAYPTLLFINAKGDLVKRSVGLKNSQQLLDIAKTAR